MEVVWKYPLEATFLNEIMMPKGSRILCVQTQKECPCLWVLVPEEEGKKPDDFECRKFVVVGTGHPLESLWSSTYIGTVQVAGGQLVFHIFERE
jgi:hypothetical protein